MQHTRNAHTLEALMAQTDAEAVEPDAPVAPEHVLVVDDSRAQLGHLTALLRRWGHKVTATTDPIEALNIAQTTDIRLIISDWMMPDLTGPDLCRHLRDDAQTGYAYIILLTSNSEAGALAEGLEAGADDFLAKPLRSPELRARLNAGARIVRMQRQMAEKNDLLSSALGEIRDLYAEIDRDLDEARRLQQSLLQNKSRRIGNAHLSMWLQASGHVGGDMLGFFPVSHKIVGAFSLDVSGHGVASAMIAARIAGILSDASPDQNISLMRREDGSLAALPPDMVASRLNTMLLKELQTDKYFTMCLGFLNTETGLLRLVQAGHPHPMLLRADGGIEHVGDGGLPIGLVQEAEFTTTEVRLHPGDRVLLYSDGLTECPAPDGTQLDEDGLARLMRKNADRSGPAFLEGIETDLAAFAGTDSFPDDASALLISYDAPARGNAPITRAAVPGDADAG